jgi:hypothetical protein
MPAACASAASSSGQYVSSSGYSPPVCELMITPFSLSSVAARSISAAAARGSQPRSASYTSGTENASSVAIRRYGHG